MGPLSCLAREALLSLIQHLQYLHQYRAFDTQYSVMVPAAPYKKKRPFLDRVLFSGLAGPEDPSFRSPRADLALENPPR